MDSRPNTLFFRHIIQKIFLEDWVMKVVALAITLALWLGVTGLSTPATERLTAVRLDFRYSNNIEVTNSPPRSVDLVVTGDKRKLAQIKKDDLIVSVDISDVPPGDRIIPLTPETVSVSLLSGVRLDEIQPAGVVVRIEAVEEKEVEVKVVTEGSPPEGYELYSPPVITPPKVGVRGPAGFMRSLEFVSTEQIDLTAKTSDFVAMKVQVGVSNPQASVTNQGAVVDVAFRIGEKRIERVYSVPVGDGRRARVVLFGPQSLFEDLDAEDIRIETSKTETGDETARAILPPSFDGKVEIKSVKLRG